MCCLAVSLAAVYFSIHAARGEQFEIAGRVETVREDRTLTALFKKRPVDKHYHVIEGTTVYATIEIRAVVPFSSGSYRFRVVAAYHPTNAVYERLIRAGLDVGSVKDAQPSTEEYADDSLPKENVYRPSIRGRDGKEMVLVPEGPFLFGSNTGDHDEYPERVITLDDFYIDKYEVSNEEFRRYVTAVNTRPPASWSGTSYREGEGDFPVLVTYYEAEAYARWAGKRLPTEEEWEKAARGSEGAEGAGRPARIYPWGARFDPERANCEDLWSQEKIGAHIKMRFNAGPAGLLPVIAFDPEGASPYGAVNMAGNAREWTSSWYMPYQGNYSKRGAEYRRYGKQFKVVRGGSWYSPRFRLRVTSREIGGSPSLRTDNTAGFRCVKDASPLDRER